MASSVWAWAASIVLLFRRSGPATVGRFVVSIVVNAIDGMLLRWPAAHIGKEVQIGIAPTITDPNASAAIVRELFMERTQTAGAQATPCGIFGSDPSGGRVAVLDSYATSASLSPQTSTTACLLAGYRVTPHDAFGAAITAAPPLDARPNFIGTFKHGQATRSVAGFQDDWFGHGGALEVKPRPYVRWLVGHCRNHPQVEAMVILP